MKWTKANGFMQGDKQIECWYHELEEEHPKYGSRFFVTENRHGTFDVEYFAYGGFCTIETLETADDAMLWAGRFIDNLEKSA